MSLYMLHVPISPMHTAQFYYSMPKESASMKSVPIYCRSLHPVSKYLNMFNVLADWMLTERDSSVYNWPMCIGLYML